MFAAVAAAAVLGLAATSLGVAGALGNFFDGTDPFVANLALTAISAFPIALALAAWFHARRLRGASRELRRLSKTDTLTGLPNRAALPDVLDRAFDLSRGPSVQTAALFCDLDRFKLVNDTYGHEVGDRLMQDAAQRIRDAAGLGSTVVRYGGDEFVVVAPVAGRPEAERIAARLVKALETPFEIGTDTMRISVSVGVALTDDRTTTGDDLLRDADVAMYSAKSIGAGAICVFDQSMRARLSRSTAESRLRAAIDGGEIDLRYEPVLAIRDGQLVGVRAHLHWDDPQRGAVPPREFLPALEETGLVIEVGAWAIEEACRQARRWRQLAPERGGIDVVVAVTARQLAQANFRDLVARAAQSAGAERAQLCLAVNDGFLAEDITDAWTMLRHVRTLGVQVGLDGFGGGASTLANLRRVKLDQLCIDRSLVVGLDHDSDDIAIVEHIVELAHRLGLLAVASDVDNANQLALLRRVGCDRARGPFLGLALRPAEIDVLVVKSRALDGVPPAPQRAVPPETAFAVPAGALPRLRPYA